MTLTNFTVIAAPTIHMLHRLMRTTNSVAHDIEAVLEKQFENSALHREVTRIRFLLNPIAS